MSKIVSRKLATKDSWIFSKSFHVFTPQKTNEKKKSEKVKTKEKKLHDSPPLDKSKMKKIQLP